MRSNRSTGGEQRRGGVAERGQARREDLDQRQDADQEDHDDDEDLDERGPRRAASARSAFTHGFERPPRLRVGSDPPRAVEYGLRVVGPRRAADEQPPEQWIERSGELVATININRKGMMIFCPVCSVR